MSGCSGSCGIPVDRISSAVYTQSSTVVRTSEGDVRGSVADGVASWKGIQFAARPVGQLRWRAPQPAPSWTGVRDAIEYQHDCMQLPFGGDAAPIGTTPSEDCLYVNIWKPANATGRLPVLVWIYGGGWVNGGSSPGDVLRRQLGEGRDSRRQLQLPDRSLRLVRASAAHPGERGQETADQLRHAGPDCGAEVDSEECRCIRRRSSECDRLGGSAGGVSIHVLNTSPLTEGLYHKAIIMSGANGGDLGTANLADAEALGLNFARRKGLADDDPQALVKLRGMSTEEIVDGLNLSNSSGGNPPTFNPGGPIVDGTIVTNIGQAYASGAFRRVPMMIGATSRDMGGRTGFMVGGARQISGTLADKSIPTYYYRFSYVPESLDREAASHASDIP
jgi:para-nitrobenzyl esterase